MIDEPGRTGLQAEGRGVATVSVKPMSGRARAGRFTMSVIAAVSARSDFMNFRRAGVA